MVKVCVRILYNESFDCATLIKFEKNLFKYLW